jgi:bifunctional DNase/RNase
MKEKVLLMGLVVAVVFVIGFLSGLRTEIRTEGLMTEADLNDIPHLSTDGFSEADIQVGPSAVFLTSGCQRISMVTNDVQTDSIAKGMLNITDVRPTTHDMITYILDNFDIEPMMVKIESLKDGIYYSKIIMKQGNNILNLDARPTDSIAIAVRTGAPVYVKDELLAEAGEKIC